MSERLARDVRMALGRISRRLRRLYADAEPGPGFLALAVMSRLERIGAASPGNLSGDEGVTSAAIATCLAHLEALGYVTRRRDETDGRRVVVALTAAGQQTLRRRDDASVERIARVLEALSAKERKALAAAVPVLERMAELI